MSQTLVNVRMDKEVKEEMESTCKELGMTMSTAFNIFARKMAREKRIPFDKMSVQQKKEMSRVNSAKKIIRLNDKIDISNLENTSTIEYTFALNGTTYYFESSRIIV